MATSSPLEISPDNRSPWPLWRDREPRDGPEHMGWDEALLLTSTVPLLRFYRWVRPELTLGFFTPLAAFSDLSAPATRRWTGGGMVEHGKDITFALIIPRPFLGKSGAAASARYRWIHECLAMALVANGIEHAAAVPQPALPGNAETSPPGPCFTEPVAWDLIDSRSGQKLAGGAQRRSRAGLLHQGSVRLPEAYRSLDHPWISHFARELSAHAEPPFESVDDPGPEAMETAARLTRERYRSRTWQERF